MSEYWMRRGRLQLQRLTGALSRIWRPTASTTGSPPRPARAGPSFRPLPRSRAPQADQKVTFRLTRLTIGQLYYVAVTSLDTRGESSGCSVTVSARARRP